MNPHDTTRHSFDVPQGFTPTNAHIHPSNTHSDIRYGTAQDVHLHPPAALPPSHAPKRQLRAGTDAHPEIYSAPPGLAALPLRRN